MGMNIIEAYIKFRGQLVIFISGLSGCGKTSLAKKLSEDFKLNFIDQFKYYKKDYNEKIKLSNDVERINWDTYEAMDWDKLNKDIDKYKKNGVIVTGFALPEEQIKSEVDYHVHLSISKNSCIENRHKFLEKHKDKYKEDFDLIGTETEKLIMNKMIFPYYLDTVKKSKINKFINTNKLTDDEIEENLWKLILEDFVQPRIKKLYYEWKKEHPEDSVDKDTTPAIKSEMNTSELIGTNSDETSNNDSNNSSDKTSEDLLDDDILDDPENKALDDPKIFKDEDEYLLQTDNDIKDGPIEFLEES